MAFDSKEFLMCVYHLIIQSAMYTQFVCQGDRLKYSFGENM